MRRLSFLLTLAALGACSTAPGTGWSRASDLSVYGSMHVYARAALDQEMLCAGFSAASAADHWQRDYGARVEAVTQAMTTRYGPEALARARRTWAPSIACRDVPDPQWRDRYARLLRLMPFERALRDSSAIAHTTSRSVRTHTSSSPVGYLHCPSCSVRAS